jgi:signal transduction histidine kinase
MRSATLLDPNAEVARVLDDLAGTLVAAGAIVEVAWQPALRADPVALRAVVRALLLQALAYRGGMAPRIRVAGERADGDPCLSVADNGLPPEADGGGRPIVVPEALVARLGGRLWTEAGPDGGAVVRFTVPTPR